MPDLVIRIKKKSDGSAALSCIRPDGSTTWQQQNGQLGLFFPLHDLTHYAVETVLGLRRAFYGLVADGWALTDFAATGTKGAIPDEARVAEIIVGFFDLERATGIRETAEELEARLQERLADDKLPSLSCALSQERVDEIRATRAELFARWKAVTPGEALVLHFWRETTADTNRERLP